MLNRVLKATIFLHGDVIILQIAFLLFGLSRYSLSFGRRKACRSYYINIQPVQLITENVLYTNVSRRHKRSRWEGRGTAAPPSWAEICFTRATFLPALQFYLIFRAEIIQHPLSLTSSYAHARSPLTFQAAICNSCFLNLT